MTQSCVNSLITGGPRLSVQQCATLKIASYAHFARSAANPGRTHIWCE